MEVDRFEQDEWENVRRREGYYLVGWRYRPKGVGVTITTCQEM